MHEILHIIEHSFLHTMEHSLPLLPFLFLTYLAMEYLEHKTADKTKAVIEKGGRLGPVFGGLLGAVPQCGFSAAASSLYAGRVITLGTLIAIYLSTSDEMLPILLAEVNTIGVTPILKILAVKVVIGMTAGFFVDFVFSKKKDDHDHDHDHGHSHIHEMCEHEHCHCGEGKSIWKSALVHTVKIALFLILITFALNLVLELLGNDVLENFLLNKPVIGQFLAGLVGLIPNCASSVVLTRLCLEGAMSFAACMSGLLVGAGIGVLVLFRVNKDKKENVKIVLLLYAIGVAAGLLMELIGIRI